MLWLLDSTRYFVVFNNFYVVPARQSYAHPLAFSLCNFFCSSLCENSCCRVQAHHSLTSTLRPSQKCHRHSSSRQCSYGKTRSCWTCTIGGWSSNCNSPIKFNSKFCVGIPSLRQCLSVQGICNVWHAVFARMTLCGVAPGATLEFHRADSCRELHTSSGYCLFIFRAPSVRGC